MSEKLRSLGVPPEYFAHAKHYAGVFRNLGMTPRQIDDAIRWGAAFMQQPRAESHDWNNPDLRDEYLASSKRVAISPTD